MNIAKLSPLNRTHLIGLMGQSNAAGVSNVDNPDTGVYPPKMGQFIFNPVSTKWQALQQNYNNEGVPNDYLGHIGCEIKLMQLLHDYYKTDQYLIKYANGGTSMDIGDDSMDNWSPLSARPIMFKGCVTNYLQAVSANPFLPKMKVLIWIQGENDTDPVNSNNYNKNLKIFFTAIKNQWNVPNLKVLQTLLANTQTVYNGPGKVIINNAKINYSINGNKYINIDGAEVQTDGVHFTTNGYDYIAQKLFDVLITML